MVHYRMDLALALAWCRSTIKYKDRNENQEKLESKYGKETTEP